MEERPYENNISESEVYEEFPFLQSFPFHEYSISLDQSEYDPNLDGIDPVVLKESGKMGAPDFLIFKYASNVNMVALSFYTYDVSFILDRSDKIKKLDHIREELDRGIESDSILEKIKSIKLGHSFIKKIGTGLSVGKSFDGLLNDFIDSSGFKISSSNLKRIKIFSSTLKEDEFRKEIRNIILTFYNIHLNHTKIILGMVIAAKIH